MTYDVSIVVPVYNEALSITALAERVTAEMQQLNVSYELILVNDGSADYQGLNARKRGC